MAVIPDLDTSTTYEGLNRTMAMALGDALGRTKDIRVVGPDQIKEAHGQGGSHREAESDRPNSRPWVIIWGCRALS